MNVPKKSLLALSALLAAALVAVPLAMACGSGAGPKAAASDRPQRDSRPPNPSNPSNPSTPPPVSGRDRAGSDVSTVKDANGYTITVSGGYTTDEQDHGRPVVLIAAALGVPTEVFRKAFSGVTPAGTDTDGPTQEQAQSNKAALLKVLSPYGITNDRLDEVSNYYRYNGAKGEVWKRTPATLATTVKDGKLTGIAIANAGAGYTTAPVVTVVAPDGTKRTAKTTVAYGKDFKTNGSLATVTLQ